MPSVVLNARIQRGVGGPSPEAYAAALRDPGTWASAVGEVLVEDIEQRFQTESDPWGAAWAALAPSTVRMRIKRGRAGKILQVTRNLANSKFWRLQGKRLVIGMGAAYAKYHQLGTNRMPARPMMPFRSGGAVDMPQRLLREIRETVYDAIRLAINRAA